jgi:hypothetical protein
MTNSRLKELKRKREIARGNLINARRLGIDDAKFASAANGAWADCEQYRQSLERR